MDRRSFNIGMLAAAAAPAARAAGARPSAGDFVFYASVADRLTRYALDPASGTIVEHETLRFPSAIQYASPHPDRRFLYVTTSDAPPGSAGPVGERHRLCAVRIGDEGVLAMHGAPAPLRQRPIHNSLDATGRFALVCYSSPAYLTVHRIAPDGTVGAPVEEPAGLDFGIFPHQVRTLPGNRSAVLVTRGNSATPKRPEDPGALKLFRLADGRLEPLANLPAGGHGGYGYGPRHLDFHPSRPWCYVSVERQHELHMHRIAGDGLSPEPLVVRTTMSAPDDSGGRTLAGAIHVHPRGHVVYVSNRASDTVDFAGRPVFRGGENSIAVFAIDPGTGAPTLRQHIDPAGFHVRAFTIDPSGRWLVAATMIDMLVREGDGVKRVSAGLSVFRIAADGTLAFVGKHDVATPGGDQQLWIGSATMG